MRVQVTKQGYYDLKRRYEGEILDIEPKLFSEKWMQKLDGEKATPSRKNRKEIEQSKETSHSSDDDVI
jgi:hypothetical protein